MFPFKSSLSLTAILMTLSSYADQSIAEATTKNTLVAGYTAPAGIDMGRSWEASIKANFILWEALQDNMELGASTSNPTTTVLVDGNMINCSTNYRPGFQVGLGCGFDHDGWDTELNYTWFTSNQITSKRYSAASNMWIFPALITPQNSLFQSAVERWHLELNCFDWILDRTSQFGKQLTLQPSFGLRAAWIDQKNRAAFSVSNTSADFIFYKSVSNSWGLGPEMGLSSHWLIGSGFKLFGDIETDLLYTNYTKLGSEENRISSAGSLKAYRNVRQHNLKLLRPHADLEVGVDWGTYFCKDSAHFDLSLGYGFQIFWDQNMFRKFMSNTSRCSSHASNGDLYLQGLTLSTRLDF